MAVLAKRKQFGVAGFNTGQRSQQPEGESTAEECKTEDRKVIPILAIVNPSVS